MPIRCNLTGQVDPNIAQRLEQEARARGIGMSPLIREILTKHVERQQQEQKGVTVPVARKP